MDGPVVAGPLRELAGAVEGIDDPDPIRAQADRVVGALLAAGAFLTAGALSPAAVLLLAGAFAAGAALTAARGALTAFGFAALPAGLMLTMCLTPAVVPLSPALRCSPSAFHPLPGRGRRGG